MRQLLLDLVIWFVCSIFIPYFYKFYLKILNWGWKRKFKKVFEKNDFNSISIFESIRILFQKRGFFILLLSWFIFQTLFNTINFGDNVQIAINFIFIIGMMSSVSGLLYVIPKDIVDLEKYPKSSLTSAIWTFGICNVFFAAVECLSIIRIEHFSIDFINEFSFLYITIFVMEIVNFKYIYDVFDQAGETKYFQHSKSMFCTCIIIIVFIDFCFTYFELGLIKVTLENTIEECYSLFDWTVYCIGKGIQETDSIAILNTEQVFAYLIAKLNIIGWIGIIISTFSGKIK